MRDIYRLIFIVIFATASNVVQSQECPKLKVVQLALGNGYTIFLMSNGDMYSAGHNGKGQLGIGFGTNKYTPTKIESIKDVKLVSAGYGSNSCITKEGVMYSWGENDGGQLGDGTKTNKNTPMKVLDGEIVGGNVGVSFVEVGLNHALCVKEGVVYSWGDNYFGQLGNGIDGMDIGKTTPIKVSDGVMINDGVSIVSAGYGYSLALKDGIIYSWGTNHEGELGDGTTEKKKNVPVKVNDGIMGNTGIFTVSAGGDHSLALKDGIIYSWGDNEFGQLGYGTTEDKNIPIKVSDGVMGNNNIIDIVAVSGSSFALKSSEEVYSWGYNFNGQLGDGNRASRYTPVKVSDGIMGNQRVTYISGSFTGSTVMAIRLDRIYAWGNNYYGQYGDGTREMSLTAVPTNSILEDLYEYPTVELESKVVGNNKVELTIIGDGAPYDVFKDRTLIIDSYQENKISLDLDLNVKNNILVQNKYGCQREIVIGGNFIVKINKEDGGCEEKSDGMIEIVIEKGVAPYRVYLNEKRMPGSITATTYKIKNLSKGEYNVKIIDNRDNIRIFDVEIGIKPEIVISTSNIKGDACGKGGSVDIKIEGGTSPYKMILKIGDEGVNRVEPNGNTYTFDKLSSGTYGIEVEDVRGCKKEISNIEIGITPELKVEKKKLTPEVCGIDGSIDIEIEGGTIPYKVILKVENEEVKKGETESSTYTFDKLIGGIYVIEVEDARGCKKEISNVEIGTTPELKVANSNLTHEICGNKNGVIEVEIEGGTSPYKVILKIDGEEIIKAEPEGNTHTFDGLSSETYVIEVEDARGCKKEMSNVNIDNEEVELIIENFSNETCIGSEDGKVEISIKEGLPPYDVYLNGILIEENTESRTHKIEKLSSGSHEIKVEDSRGCVDKKEQIIESNDVTISVDKGKESCGDIKDGWIELSVNMDSPYDIYLDDDLMAEKITEKYIIDSLSKGVYNLKVVGVGNGCEILEVVEIGDESTCDKYKNLDCLEKPYIVFKGEEKLVFECVDKDKYKIYLRIIDNDGVEVYKNDNYDNETIKGIGGDTFLTLFYIVHLTNKNTGEKSKIYTSYIERVKKN